MKKLIFCQCDRCIGIMPCKALKDGRIICECCKDEVSHIRLKHISSGMEPSYREQHV
ncbi:MAG: hypothetical protein WBF32_12535 [Candidatus Aminicenantaceae bacterium]